MNNRREIGPNIGKLSQGFKRSTSIADENVLQGRHKKSSTSSSTAVNVPYSKVSIFANRRTTTNLRPITKEIVERRTEIVFKKCLETQVEGFGGGDMLLSGELANDINKYLLGLTYKYQLKPDFLQDHPGRVDGRMRSILVDWLVHLQRRFQLLTETLSLSIWLLDRGLLKLDDITKANLQLLGIACMFVAAKFEEISVPNIHDFIFVAGDNFSKNDVFKMEQQLLRAVDYNCSVPHSIQFLRRYRYYLSPPREVHALAKYICDVGHITYCLAHHRPSTMAAASIYLSCFLLNYTIKSDFYHKVTDLSEMAVSRVAQEFVSHIIQYAQPNAKLFALRDKYNKYAPINFSDEQIARLEKFSRNVFSNASKFLLSPLK